MDKVIPVHGETGKIYKNSDKTKSRILVNL